MLEGRHLFIHKLAPVVKAETSLRQFARKARKARLSSVWIKVAVGKAAYPNVAPLLAETIEALAAVGVGVWGWTEPRCATQADAVQEATLAASLAAQYGLGGIVIDAEKPEGQYYFQGGAHEADVYASTLRQSLNADARGLALCSHDIPDNFSGFPFASFAAHAEVNCPQVYYGGSPSVRNRLERAIKANVHVAAPFVPIGAAWIGDAGGCASASAVVERAATFIDLVHAFGFQGYGFWHWAGAPNDLWPLLYDTPV